MSSETFDVGIVGLGVMGRNLALNFSDHGYSIIGLDADAGKAAALEREGSKGTLKGTTAVGDFIAALKKPRTVMMLVPAGDAVDSVIAECLPFLERGDAIIDAGNSCFKETNRRLKMLENEGVHYLGVGISGGETGARHGPSIMPGGAEDAYERVRPLFEVAAAQVGDDPCVAWLGPGSAGHYVKMVHNGIEYGLMQLIAECYDLMRRGPGFSNDRLHRVFAEWNQGELESYLVEITARIFQQPDDRSGGRLIDAIQDRARQKGTGQWASQDAMELQVPTPTIDAAVGARAVSAQKEQRVRTSRVLVGPGTEYHGAEDVMQERLRNALYLGMIATYAQGFAQLQAASSTYGYRFSLADVAGIWRGGCIIRARLLDAIRSAFLQNPALVNLMLDPSLSSVLNERQSDLRLVVGAAVELGIPVPGLMTCLTYFDSYRSDRLPANLIQAQRDFFGSHTYERLDLEGTFHTRWMQ